MTVVVDHRAVGVVDTADDWVVGDDHHSAQSSLPEQKRHHSLKEVLLAYELAFAVTVKIVIASDQDLAPVTRLDALDTSLEVAHDHVSGKDDQVIWGNDDYSVVRNIADRRVAKE